MNFTKQTSLQALLCLVVLCTLPGQTTEIKERRTAWACPNKLSFDKCGHNCKWMIFKSGKLDRQNERRCGSEIASHSPHLQAVYEYVDKNFGSCGKDADFVRATTPCNYFVGQMLRDVFNVSDFQRSMYGGFLTASEINSKVTNSRYTLYGGGWDEVSAEDAIIQANAGSPVIASTKQHVALVIPGAYVESLVSKTGKKTAAGVATGRFGGAKV